MPFRFKRKEPLTAAFARLGAEGIAAATAALAQPAAAGVHEARKTFKRLRALLRLFRSGLEKKSAKDADRVLRAASRQLAAVRDSQVKLTAFDALARGGAVGGLGAVRTALASRLDLAISREEPRVRELIARLKKLAGRFPALAEDAGWTVLRRGLKRAYRRARDAHAEARAELSIEAFHTWRRRCKDYEAQLQLLGKAGGDRLEQQLRKLAKLNDALGVDRDLAALAEVLSTTAGKPREKLTRRIARRRKKLQRRAFDLANELFFPKPGDVVDALGRAWKKWHRG